MSEQMYSKRRASARPRQGFPSNEQAVQPAVTSAFPTDGASRIDLPEAMRAKMESAYGMDLSAVKLYQSQRVAEGGAEAVAMGNTIAFAPGKFDISSSSGQALLGHELSHVVSQARGEVAGSGVVNDYALEARADREGAMAAAGQQIYSGPITAPMSSASPAAMAGPMQCKKGHMDNMRKRNADSRINEISQLSNDLMEVRVGKDYYDTVEDRQRRSDQRGNIDFRLGMMREYTDHTSKSYQADEMVGDASGSQIMAAQDAGANRMQLMKQIAAAARGLNVEYSNNKRSFGTDKAGKKKAKTRAFSSDSAIQYENLMSLKDELLSGVQDPHIAKKMEKEMKSALSSKERKQLKKAEKRFRNAERDEDLYKKNQKARLRNARAADKEVKRNVKINNDLADMMDDEMDEMLNEELS